MDDLSASARSRGNGASGAGRRGLLCLCLPATAALSVSARGGAVRRSALPRESPLRLARRIRGTFRDPVTAGELGRRYLAANPPETDLVTLLDLVLADAPPPSGRWALAAMIGRLRHDDFAAGRLAWVDCRALSLTEARACAIAALA